MFYELFEMELGCQIEGVKENGYNKFIKSKTEEVRLLKKTNKNTSIGIAMGMCFGVAMGTSMGTVFDNISMGSSMGLIIGMLIGLVIGAMKDEKVNKQLKEKGYTILAIEQNETDEVYIITIVNSANEESLIYVPKGQMETENFQVGDIVYLDDDGMIEQAFDREEV